MSGTRPKEIHYILRFKNKRGVEHDIVAEMLRYDGQTLVDAEWYEERDLEGMPMFSWIRVAIPYAGRFSKAPSVKRWESFAVSLTVEEIEIF
jgi:hypothetical protein